MKTLDLNNTRFVSGGVAAGCSDDSQHCAEVISVALLIAAIVINPDLANWIKYPIGPYLGPQLPKPVPQPLI